MSSTGNTGQKTDSPNKDTNLAWPLRSEWMMVWATLLYTLVTVGMLCAIYGQSKLLLASERAWVTVSNIPELPVEITPHIAQTIAVFAIQIQNFGKTMCRAVEIRTRFHTVKKLDSLPSSPEYVTAADTTEYWLAPRGPSLTLTAILQDGVLSEAQVLAIRSGDLFLCFYASVKYVDFFRKERLSQFCYVYNYPRGLILEGLHKPGFRIGGPKRYNHYT